MLPFSMEKFTSFKIVIPIYTRQIFLQTNTHPCAYFCLFVNAADHVKQLAKLDTRYWLYYFGVVKSIPLNRSKIPKVVCGWYLFPDINSLLEGALWHLPTKILNTDSNKAHHIYMIITSVLVWLARANQHFYYMFCEYHEALLKIILWTHAINN